MKGECQDTLEDQWYEIICQGSLEHAILFIDENPDYEPDLELTFYYITLRGHIHIFRYMCEKEEIKMAEIVRPELLINCSTDEAAVLIKDCLLQMNYEEKVEFFYRVLKNTLKHIIDAVKEGLLESEIVIVFLRNANNLTDFLHNSNDICLQTWLEVIPCLSEIIISAKEKVVGNFHIWFYHQNAFKKEKVLMKVLHSRSEYKSIYYNRSDTELLYYIH